MEINNIRARLRKLLCIPFRLCNHQMHVKHHFACLANALDDRHAKGNIRHKYPIHHVQMQVRHASLLQQGKLFAHARKICRKQRRGKKNVHVIFSSLLPSVLHKTFYIFRTAVRKRLCRFPP